MWGGPSSSKADEEASPLPMASRASTLLLYLGGNTFSILAWYLEQVSKRGKRRGRATDLVPEMSTRIPEGVVNRCTGSGIGYTHVRL